MLFNLTVVPLCWGAMFTLGGFLVVISIWLLTKGNVK